MLVCPFFAELEDLCVVRVSDEILRFIAELVDLLPLLEVLKEGFFVRVALELLNQLVDCLCQEFCSQRCCSRFPEAFLIRLVGHKMFLHPVHVDLVNQFANSILVQPAVLSESKCTFW